MNKLSSLSYSKFYYHNVYGNSPISDSENTEKKIKEKILKLLETVFYSDLCLLILLFMDLSSIKISLKTKTFLGKDRAGYGLRKINTILCTSNVTNFEYHIHTNKGDNTLFQSKNNISGVYVTIKCNTIKYIRMGKDFETIVTRQNKEKFIFLTDPIIMKNIIFDLSDPTCNNDFMISSNKQENVQNATKMYYTFTDLAMNLEKFIKVLLNSTEPGDMILYLHKYHFDGSVDLVTILSSEFYSIIISEINNQRQMLKDLVF